jgi:O-antigen ligase
VAARFDYWTAAVRIARAHPVFGTGPGTFSRSYERVKPAGAEMTRLAHNDYLEQASDSGVIGFLSYLVFVCASLVRLHPRSKGQIHSFAVWLGLVGWACQSMVEFSLYIPALAWPAFLFLGSLSASPRNEHTYS